MPYQQAVTTKEKAICHLLLFFSLYEDETFEGEETHQVFSILQSYPLTAGVDFPEEVNRFFDYKNEIEDVLSYFHYLVQIIGSESSLLLLFHATQVALSDTVFSEKENDFLSLLRLALDVEKPAASIVFELALAERNLKMRNYES